MMWTPGKESCKGQEDGKGWKLFALHFGPDPTPTKVDGETITGPLSSPSVWYSSKELYPDGLQN